MKVDDANLATELFNATIVGGVKSVRVRRNTVPTPCDMVGCLEVSGYIPPGAPFVRVAYDDGRGREHFHINCYQNEFIA